MQAMHEVELSGHIIDSNLMARVFDSIMDMGGEFEVLEFTIGKRKEDTSYCRLVVMGRDDEHLMKIITTLHGLGARLPESEEIQLSACPDDRVLPDGFYSTTNHPTYVNLNGEWVTVRRQKMDSMIVVKDGAAVATTLGHIRKGDDVVIGTRGVRVIPPERPRRKSIFEFMGGGASSERPKQALFRQIASEILELKKDGGRIAVVAGPAVIHTMGSESLAWLVREGYVDVLLSGNALAVHDVEYALFGTSLGMKLNEVELAPGGHKNHIYAISEIWRCGGLKQAVKKGILKSGVMYECIRGNVEFILAGSIRDDGPLPEVITDAMEAQDAYRDAVQDVNLVLMLSTTLHSIAAGNCLPSTVRTICVDINPAVVQKLMDRGTAQAIGVVTDVGVFLPMLVDEIKSQRG